MTLPNFLIIGAAKAGTTALYWYLDQHPQVYMSPEKEPRFFSWVGQEWDPTNPALRKTINTLEKYEALFEGVQDEVAIGEASPSYLFNPNAPVNIKKYIPETKLVAVLRNPAERAFSHFLHFIKCEYEKEYNFDKAIRDIEGYKIGNWTPREDYINFGFYGKQLRHYYDLFDKDQIKVYLHEDLKNDTPGILRDIYGFLGVDSGFQTDVSIQHNVSGIPKNRWIQNLVSGKSLASKLTKPLKLLIPKKQRALLKNRVGKMNLERPSLSGETRAYLISIYKNDIKELQQLIDRDLSHWITA